MDKIVQPKVLFVTTGRINPDGKLYYPPLVAAQIKSLTPSLAAAEIVILFSFRPGAAWKTLKQIRQYALRADLVHAQYGSFTAFFAWLGSRGKPLVISFGGSDLLGSASAGWKAVLRNKLTYFFGNIAARKSKAIIVKSSNLLEALPMPLRNKTSIVPNGVNTTVFYPMSKNEARSKLGWNAAHPYIVFTPSRANNVIVKNVTLALRVAELVKGKRNGTVLEYILDKSPEEVNLMMNAADCLLLTSLHEGSPNVIKEAMACNLPIVSTRVGDVSERLNHVHPSFVVSTWDENELSERVSDILAMNNRSNGAEALKHQNLTDAAVADAILHIYQNILPAHK